MPNDWNLRLLVPIFKKGDASKSDNYRGITLLNVTYKIMISIMLKKLKVYTEVQEGGYHNGFGPGNFMIHAIHIPNKIKQKFCVYNIGIQIVFIDFKQALIV